MIVRDYDLLMKHWKGNFYLKSSNQLLVSHPSEIYLKIVEWYELASKFWTFPPLFFILFFVCLFVWFWGIFFCYSVVAKMKDCHCLNLFLLNKS